MSEDVVAKFCYSAEKMPTMSALTCDILRTILVFLSISSNGAEDVARVMLTCKALMNLSKDSEVLKAINWKNVRLEDRCRFFQHIDGLLCKSAEAGNQTAVYVLSKVVLFGSTPLWSRMLENDNLLASVNHMNYTEANKKRIIQMFKEEARRETPFISSIFDGNLHHKSLVRSFLVGCSGDDIVQMRYNLETYTKYFSGPEASTFTYVVFDGISKMCTHVQEVYNELLGLGVANYISEDIMGESGSSAPLFNPPLLMTPSQEEAFESLRAQLISDFDRLFPLHPVPAHPE